MNESGIILALSYIFLPFVIYFLINTIFFIVFYYKRYSIYANKKYIGRKVHVVMDRKIGSTHPKHPNIVYPINYGYIPGLLGGDGEEQDVYILGVDKPIDEFDGRIIAVIYRYNDNETKWVAANMYDDYSIDYIKKVTHFQEQYYKIKIIK
jgi:inorganic pyrophosphatase